MEGAGRVTEAYAAATARAHFLAVDRHVQRALLRGDVGGLERILGVRESATITGGVAIGELPKGRPAARVVVTSEDLPIGIITVALPELGVFVGRFDRIGPSAGDVLAVEQGGKLTVAPPGLRGVAFGGDEVTLGGITFRARSVQLPHYEPPARLVALADESEVASVLTPLQTRLAVAGLLSLVAVVLLASALARPLLRSLGVVESAAAEAEIDPLTRVANRRGFERALTLEVERAARYGRTCALVLVDLDDFKSVNDRFGHDAGDAVLGTLAHVLRKCTRNVDVPARLGGEEFALLLPETDTAGAVRTAERVRRELAATPTPIVEGEPVIVTASLGVATGGRDVTGAELLRRADAALYAAKRAGKNRVETHDVASSAAA